MVGVKGGLSAAALFLKCTTTCAVDDGAGYEGTTDTCVKRGAYGRCFAWDSSPPLALLHLCVGLLLWFSLFARCTLQKASFAEAVFQGEHAGKSAHSPHYFATFCGL